MRIKKLIASAVIIVSAILTIGGMAAFASDPISETEEARAEEVSYSADVNRELIDVVYFKSEAGNTVMSDVPFSAEERR